MFLKITKLAIPDLLLLEPRVFGDDRGFFFESFNAKNFRLATGFQSEFVQDNHSKSVKGVVRGLHYQLPPMAQAKLVRVVQGEVFDVAVDIRKNSATFGEWVGTALSAQNKHILWIPEGFAHGFMTISDTAEFLYKTTNYYDPDLERGIRWDDPQINIRWPISEKIQLSAKDERNGLLKNAECF
jgi:dTDP-4-dehydrorhamnose 3,5-epimerase